MKIILHRMKAKFLTPLPAFAESPGRKGGNECEKGIHRSYGEGGSASADSAEDVKMSRLETRVASLRAFQLIYGFKALLESVSKEWIEEFCGFTLLELTVVIGVISTLSAFAIPSYQNYIEKARITKAIAEVRILDREIFGYGGNNEELPNTLGSIGRGKLKDPWGNPYKYLNFKNIKGKGGMRKDRFLVPLNTDYDLYSMGKDGASRPPLTAGVSHDDIIRANNGSYIGIASEY